MYSTSSADPVLSTKIKSAPISRLHSTRRDVVQQLKQLLKATLAEGRVTSDVFIFKRSQIAAICG